MLRDVRDVHAGTERSFDVFVCKDCASTELATRLSPAELATLYPDDYYSYVEDRRRVRPFDVLRALSYDRHRFLPSFTSLLEVGCGRGEFLARIKDTGKVVGLEVSEAARAGGARIGVEIVVSSVDEPDVFAPGAFDYVYTNHAFEHLSDPNRALDSIGRWLKPGGKLFIAVPARSSAAARLFGKNWYYLAPPIHVTGSSPRGIRRLLDRHGFDIENIAYNSDPISLPASLLIALGRETYRLTLPAKLLLGILTLVATPIARLLDLLGWGDCMEVHAVKR